MIKNYVEPFTVGVLEIIGLYSETDTPNFPDYIVNGIEMGVFGEYHFTLQPDNAPFWQCWRPLICHGNQIIEETGGKLVCIFGTRNCAGNVGATEVRAILNCLFDGVFDA